MCLGEMKNCETTASSSLLSQTREEREREINNMQIHGKKQTGSTTTATGVEPATFFAQDSITASSMGSFYV